MWKIEINTLNASDLKRTGEPIDPQEMDEYRVAVSSPIIPLETYINNILDYIVEKGIEESVILGPYSSVRIFYSDIRRDLGLGDNTRFSEDIMNCIRYWIAQRKEIMLYFFDEYSVIVDIREEYIKNAERAKKKKEKKKLKRSIAKEVLQKYNLSEFRLPDVLQMVVDLLQVEMELLIDEYPEYPYTINNIQTAIKEVKNLVYLFMIDENVFNTYLSKVKNKDNLVCKTKFEDLIFSQYGFAHELFDNNIVIDTDSYIYLGEDLKERLDKYSYYDYDSDDEDEDECPEWI